MLQVPVLVCDHTAVLCYVDDAAVDDLALKPTRECFSVVLKVERLVFHDQCAPLRTATRPMITSTSAPTAMTIRPIRRTRRRRRLPMARTMPRLSQQHNRASPVAAPRIAGQDHRVPARVDLVTRRSRG